jgi:dolichol-phosphate mannosyltransferase
MIEGQKVAVVLPAFRTAREIGGVLQRMPDVVDHVIVVDDASPDDLAAAVEACRDPRITLLRLEKNQGVGGATVAGMEHALDLGCAIVVKCDSDGQMDPQHIPWLLEPIAEGIADHVKGSRFHHVRELRRMPRLRFLGNVVLTFLTKLSSGYWNILDPVNGFFATRADVLRALPLHRLARRYFFESDLLLRLNVVEARVMDVALPAHYGDEHSSLSLSRAIFEFPPRLMSGMVKRVFWRYVFYDVSPVAVFGVVGTLLVTFGVLFGAYQWSWHWMHDLPTPTGTVMLAVLPLIFGFQLVLQAIVLDIYNTPRAGRREADQKLRGVRGSLVRSSIDEQAAAED